MAICLALMQLLVLCTLISTPLHTWVMSCLGFTPQEFWSPSVEPLSLSLAQAVPHCPAVEDRLVMSGPSMHSQPIVLARYSGVHRTSAARSFHLLLSLIRM